MHVQALDSATTHRHCGGRGRRMLIISVSELLEIAVKIIENEKIPFQPKNHVWIIREVELLEQILYAHSQSLESVAKLLATDLVCYRLT